MGLSKIMLEFYLLRMAVVGLEMQCLAVQAKSFICSPYLETSV